MLDVSDKAYKEAHWKMKHHEAFYLVLEESNTRARKVALAIIAAFWGLCFLVVEIRELEDEKLFCATALCAAALFASMLYFRTDKSVLVDRLKASADFETIREIRIALAEYGVDFGSAMPRGQVGVTPPDTGKYL